MGRGGQARCLAGEEGVRIRAVNDADYAILAVLGLSMLFGLFRGFVGEVLSLACWIAAFWVAWAFGARVAAFYSGFLHEPVACIVAGDRVLGMLFGLARGLLLVTGAVLMLGFTPPPHEAPWWRHSLLLPGFEQGAGWLSRQLPPEVTKYLEIGGKALPMLPNVPISSLPGAPDPAPASSAAPRPEGAPVHHGR